MNAADWKRHAANALAEMRNDPSPDARRRVRELLEQYRGLGAAAASADRRCAELRKAIARYDRNTARSSQHGAE